MRYLVVLLFIQLSATPPLTEEAGGGGKDGAGASGGEVVQFGGAAVVDPAQAEIVLAQGPLLARLKAANVGEPLVEEVEQAFKLIFGAAYKEGQRSVAIAMLLGTLEKMERRVAVNEKSIAKIRGLIDGLGGHMDRIEEENSRLRDQINNANPVRAMVYFTFDTISWILLHRNFVGLSRQHVYVLIILGIVFATIDRYGIEAIMPVIRRVPVLSMLGNFETGIHWTARAFEITIGCAILYGAQEKASGAFYRGLGI